MLLEEYTLEKKSPSHVKLIQPIVVKRVSNETDIDPLQTRKQRLKAIKTSWGFDCSCSLCQAPPEYVRESNRRIKTINKLRDQLNDFSADSIATPEMGELFVSLHEMERLYAGIWEAYWLTSLAYNAVGN